MDINENPISGELPVSNEFLKIRLSNPIEIKGFNELLTVLNKVMKITYNIKEQDGLTFYTIQSESARDYYVLGQLHGEIKKALSFEIDL